MGLFDFLKKHKRVELPIPDDPDMLLNAIKGMSKLDMLTGTLCSEYFRTGADPNSVLHHGAMGAMRHTLRESLDGDLSPDILLSEHRTKGKAQEATILYGEKLAKRINTDLWESVEGMSANSGMPMNPVLITWLVKEIERKHPRPRGGLHPGHFAVVIDYVTAFALAFVRLSPERAHELADEEV